MTVKIAALGLILAVVGCDSSKDSSDKQPEAGGSTAAGNGAAGKRQSSSSSTLATGGTSAGGAPTTGGLEAGSSSIGTAGAVRQSGGAPSAGTGNATGATTSRGGTGNTASSTTISRAGSAGAITGSCVTNADCAANTDNRKLCSVATGECVECLAVSDCMPSTSGGAGAGGATSTSTSTSTSTLGCVSNACVKYTACVNSLSCDSNQVCSTSLGHCVQCVSDADCAKGSRCGQNQCRTSCASDKDCTPLGLLCNTSSGYCVTCNTNSDCPANRYCSSGECLRDVCVSNSTRCQGNGVSNCSTDGSTWGSASTCSSSRTCALANGVASCQAWTCTPSTTGCSLTEQKVVNCSSDGLTATLVDDCAAKGQVCISGACAPVVCSAGQRFCQDNAVRTCSSKGESSTVYTTCSSGQYCDALSVSCKTQLCRPNQPVCNGNIATTCDAIGAGYVAASGTDCTAGASGQVCNPSTGTCASQVCTPSTYYCDNSALPSVIRYCASNGMSGSISTTCSSSYYCDSSSTSPSCKSQICTPGTATCDTKNNLATKCNAFGSGYESGGTDCTALGQICSSGACKSLVCSPSSYFCDTTATPNTIRVCSSDGMSSTLYSTCSSGQYCDATSSPTCKTQLCKANSPACNGNVATTCNAQGTGYVTGGTDCTGTAQPVCSQGVCTTSVVDTIDASASSGSTYTSTNYRQANFYAVNNSRTLTNIELYLGISTSITLTWYVYESSSQTGTYTQIWTGTSVASATGYQSSGALNVSLRAGYYYSIQTAWGATSPTAYYRSTGTFPVVLSFGSLISSAVGTTTITTYTAPSGYYFPQRLTTTAPAAG